MDVGMSVVKIITRMFTQLVSSGTVRLSGSPEPLPAGFSYHCMLWKTVIPSGTHNKLIIGHIVQQQRETCSHCFSLSCTYSQAK